MYGDPHFKTLDGNNYTFNGLGEYVVLRIDNNTFELQARTARARGRGLATVISAAALKHANSSAVNVHLTDKGQRADAGLGGCRRRSVQGFPAFTSSN